MCRKLFYLTFFILMLGSVSNAEDIQWTDLGPDHLWSTPENWDLGRVPTLVDEVLINVPAAAAPNGPVIQDGTDAKAKGIFTEAPGEPTLTMTGGTLEVADWIWWGDGADSFGIWEMSGGTVSVVNEFELGWGGGAGTLTMTGGTINAGEAVIPTGSGAFGELYLNGGTYNVTKADGLSVKENGLIDITEGTLVLEGDETAKINDLIAAGLITAYGGDGTFELDFDGRNTGKTTLTAIERALLFAEDFEGLALGPNVDEALAGDAVWTDTPPDDWSIDESGIPGIGVPATDGVAEWAGWAFADKEWWIAAAEDQDRSMFELGSGTVAVADPDEWDDADRLPIPISADPYDTWLSTPAIDISECEAGTLQLKFDSSWRPEFDDNYHQTANITASFDGAEAIEVLLWESDESSANYKPYATNEIVVVNLANPQGARSVVLTFGLFDAGNDWWWAIDNVEVSGLPIVQLDPTMFGYEDPFNLIHTVEISESGEELSYTVDNIPADWFDWDHEPPVVKAEPDLPVVPYVYHGDAAEYTPEGIGSLDGTWSHDNDSDQWDGTGPGEGRPGGAAALFEDDVTFLRIQDTGDPRDYGMADPGSNRKVYFTHAIDFGIDGAMLEFRARLATSVPLDDAHPDDGAGIVTWPDGGIGYNIRDNGKGMFGISDGVGIISFSLARAGEPGFEDAPTDVLVMNNLVGSEPSDDVDTGDAATAVNTIGVNDVTQWNTFVIVIASGGAGTHIVSVSVNDGPAEIFEVTVGTGTESENPYISIGSSGTGGITAFDVDYLSVSPNERVHPLLLKWLAEDPNQVVSVIIMLDHDIHIPRFPELPDGVTRDSPEGQALSAEVEAEIERLTAEQRVVTEQFVADALERFEVELPILDQFWLVSGFLTELPLRKVLDLAGMEQLSYIQPRFGGEPPPQDNNPNNDVDDGRAEIVSDTYFIAVSHIGFNIGLLDTGILSTHVLFNNPSRIGQLFDPVTPGCSSSFTSSSNANDAWNHGTSSAAIIVGNNNLLNDYRGVTAMTLDSYNVYDDPPGGLDSAKTVLAFQCATKSFASVIVGEIQADEWPYGIIALTADEAFDAGKAVIAANGNYGFEGEKSVRSPALAHKVIGVGAYDITTQAHYPDQGLGPTYDDRYKPDFQAPMNTETAGSDSNTCLRTFDGTSGSTPYGAGAAALIRKWLEQHNTWDPGSVYAFLINAGTIGWPNFNNTFGIGPIQLPVNGWALWGKVEVSQGTVINLKINISPNMSYLHAALWWPESLNESHDDVDVHLIDPSDQVLAESISKYGVFEFARVNGPIASGQWTVRIKGNEINSGPQIVYWTAAWHF